MLNQRSRLRENKVVKTYLGSFQLTQLVFFVKRPVRRGACTSTGMARAQFWRRLQCDKSLFLPPSSSSHTQIVRSQNILLAPLGRPARGEGQPSHCPCSKACKRDGSEGWRLGAWYSFVPDSLHLTLFSTTHPAMIRTMIRVWGREAGRQPSPPHTPGHTSQLWRDPTRNEDNCLKKKKKKICSSSVFPCSWAFLWWFISQKPAAGEHCGRNTGLPSL